jgi:hypothetical protein
MRCLPVHSVSWNKIPLADQATSGNVRPQQKAVRVGANMDQAIREDGSANIKFVTEETHRGCAVVVATEAASAMATTSRSSAP